VRNQPGALPLLQYALLELWNRREGRRITVEAYHKIGRVGAALQQRAESTLATFTAEEQELSRHIFLRLTQLGDGTEDTKRRVPFTELLSSTDKPAPEEDLIQKLEQASLLTIHAPLLGNEAFVEVAHEALIRNWPRLRKWIDQDRVGLRLHRRLTDAAEEWLRFNRDPNYYPS
jgi:conflict system STAND superfamily ATPase